MDVILNPDNSVRFIIDSYGELSGIKTNKALNGSIEYGDIKLETTDSQFGINFVPNDSKIETGIYSTESWLSLGKQNYGLDKITVTNINKQTVDFLNSVEIVEIKNGGRNNTHRTVITVPSGILSNGQYSLQLAYECVNDLIKGEFNLKLNEEKVEFEKDKVSVSELEMDITVVPELEPPDGEFPSFSEPLGDEIYIFAGVGLLAAIIMMLMGDSAGGTEAPSNVVTQDNSRVAETKKETNEPQSALVFFLLSLFLLAQRRF